jgi:DNA-binding MarR family transcriptional regulator
MAFYDEAGSLSFLVRRTWLSMRAAIGEELKEFGLSTPQYATLMIAREFPGCSNADVARKVASSRQAANELLTGLERDGLIERTPHPDDRRTQRIHLTAQGRTRLARARVAVARREAELEAAFTAPQRETAHAWLDGVADACGG